MENENNGTIDVQKKSKQKIIIVCIILGLIFITLVLLGTCRGSDKESSDQPVNVEFTENEYETLIPIYIGGIEFNCIIDEDFGSFIISSEIIERIKRQTTINIEYIDEYCALIGPIYIGGCKIDNIKTEIDYSGSVDICLDINYLAEYIKGAYIDWTNQCIVFPSTYIKDSYDGNSNKVFLYILLVVYLIAMASYFIAIFGMQKQVVITTNIFDKILLIGSAILLFLSAFQSPNSEPNQFFSIVTYSGLGLFIVSVILSVLANLPSALFITLSILAKLFIVLSMIVGLFILLIILIFMLIIFFVNRSSDDDNDGWTVVGFDDSLNALIGYKKI